MSDIWGTIEGITNPILKTASVTGDIISSIQQQKLAEQNLALQQKIANQNYGMQEKQLEFQKEMEQRNYDYMVATQQEEWQRADTAHQREVADLKASGLSPLASVNGNTTGNIVNEQGLQNYITPQYEASGIATANAEMMNAIASTKEIFKNIYTENNQNERERKKRELEIDIEDKKIKAEWEKTVAQLKEEDKKLAQEKWAKSEELKLQKENFEWQAKEADKTRLENQAESATGIRLYEKITNKKRFDYKFRLWNIAQQEKLKEATEKYSVQSKQGGGGGGINTPIFGANANGKGGISYNNFIEQEMKEWYTRNPIPIYVRD